MKKIVPGNILGEEIPLMSSFLSSVFLNHLKQVVTLLNMGCF